jgi:hypothetical protein
VQSLHLLGRREFTLQSALAMLSGVVITISGCGGSTAVDTGTSPSPSPSPSPGTGDVVGTISANHGHIAIVTRGVITAMNTLALDIRGNADHTHLVELSQSDLAAIGNGQRVSHQSSTSDGHIHQVTFN